MTDGHECPECGHVTDDITDMGVTDDGKLSCPECGHVPDPDAEPIPGADARADGGAESREAEAAILEQIRERTDPTPDGEQDANGSVWTGKRRLRSDSVKDWADWTKDDVERSVAALKRRGDIVTFHGLLAPATEDHLRAIIQNERMSDIPRQSVIGRCQDLLPDGGDDGGGEDGGEDDG